MKPRGLGVTERSGGSEQRKEIKAAPLSNGVISGRADLSSGILK